MAASERSTLIMMVATLASRVLGILKSRLVSIHFGATIVADAMNFSFNLANNFRKLFAEGSLSQAYVPQLARVKDEKNATNALVNRLVSFLSLVFVLLFLLTVLWERGMVSFLSDYKEGLGLETAASLLPAMVIFLFFISLAILVSSVLQVRGRFLASSIAPLFFTLAVLLSLHFLSDRYRHYSLAVGVVAGSIAEFLVVYIPMRKLGVKIRPDFNFTDPAFRTVMATWLPGSVSSLVAIASQSITMFLATSLQEGALTALSNAIIFYQAPYGIFFSSISAVYFPLLSGAKTDEEKGRVLAKAMNYLYTFLLPSAIILSVLSHECVASLLQKGAFTVGDTVLTASMLVCFLIAMIPMSIYAMLQRWMFASGRYGANLVVSTIISIVDVVSMVLMIHLGLGPLALPLGTLVSSTLGALVLFAFVRGFPFRDFLLSLAKISLANSPLLLVAVLYEKWNPTYWMQGSTLSVLSLTCLFGLVGLGIVALSYLAFRIDFLSQLRRKRP